MPYLLQCGGTQLDGDVLELPVAFGAKVADDVGVLVRLPQELHLSVGEAEALWKDSFHRHRAVIKLTPVEESRGHLRIVRTLL